MLNDAVKAEITIYQSVDRLTGQASTLLGLKDRLDRVVDFINNSPKPPKDKADPYPVGGGLNNALGFVCEANGKTMAEIDVLVSAIEYQFNLSATETGRR